MTDKNKYNILNEMLGITEKDNEEFANKLNEAQELIGKPVNQWPPFKITWDLYPNNFHYCLDAGSEELFSQRLQDQVILGKVNFSDLDAHLNDWTYQKGDTVWNVGIAINAARIIVHCSYGGKLTPPLIEYKENKLVVTGGNHRVRVARDKGERELYFLTLKEYKDKFDDLIKNIEWYSNENS